MKRQFFRSMWAAVLCAALAVPGLAARLLIPVGEVVGLSLSEGTVTVAAFHETYGIGAREAGLEIGDEIVSVDGRTVDSAADLYEALKRSGGTVDVELGRDGKHRHIQCSPVSTAEGPRLGVYVREGVTGIGTVTYFDPNSRKFGCLGHGISSPGGTLAPMEGGWVYEAAVESVKRGRVGEPGQLRGAVSEQTPLGSLYANTPFGVFGAGPAWLGEALPVAAIEEIRPGKAQILSNISGDTVEAFDLEIVKCYDRAGTGRDMLLKITDPRLLEATGGIVAGMSGSPIIKDGKLVGAVTHVLVNDPTSGYGIFMENMLNAAA